MSPWVPAPVPTSATLALMLYCNDCLPASLCSELLAHSVVLRLFRLSALHKIYKEQALSERQMDGQKLGQKSTWTAAPHLLCLSRDSAHCRLVALMKSPLSTQPLNSTGVLPAS